MSWHGTKLSRERHDSRNSGRQTISALRWAALHHRWPRQLGGSLVRRGTHHRDKTAGADSLRGSRLATREFVRTTNCWRHRMLRGINAGMRVEQPPPVTSQTDKAQLRARMVLRVSRKRWARIRREAGQWALRMYTAEPNQREDIDKAFNDWCWQLRAHRTWNVGCLWVRLRPRDFRSRSYSAAYMRTRILWVSLDEAVFGLIVNCPWLRSRRPSSAAKV